jgi:hypothetical protein
MLFDAHWHGFRVFEGIPGRGIYDNMKTAVDRIGVGKKRDVNARFLSMTSHYVFEPEFCNPAAGWEKGQVEKNVRDARHRLWQVMPAFPDLESLNRWLEDRCKVLWAETAHGTLPGSIADVWEVEKVALMPLPTAFDGFVELSKRVSPTCLITFDRNRYSVPASFANRPISLHIYPDRLVIVAEGHVICTHERVIDRSHQPGRVIYDWRIIWPWFSASREHCATGLRLSRCRMPSESFKIGCCASQAEIEKWSISCRWCCITMSSPCFVRLKWHWRSAFRPRPMC